MLKRGLFFSLLLLFSFTVIWYSSCIKDKCKDVVCYNGGICVDGKCACTSGYEGLHCEVKWNEKYAGKWNVADSVYRDKTARYRYDINITGEGTRDSIYISGFADTITKQILCTYTGPRTFNIVADSINPNLRIQSGNGIMDSLTGVVSGRYVFQSKIKVNETTTKDTLVTVGFTWWR